jgi:hypothetical protein
MSSWSITESDVLTVTLIYGDLEYIIRKSDMYYEPYDQDTILVTFRKFTYKKFAVTPIDVVPICYMLDWEECTSPIAASRADLLVLLEAMLQSSSDIKVQKNGTDIGQEPTLNFIEGSNITITAVDDPTNNKVDITIDASGGGGGLPPDGTYGDVVVSGAGTVWTVTDDTSNQQVAVYEDSFLRGTRPAFNFYDNGGAVNVTATDNPTNNWVDILVAYTPPLPTYLVAYDTNSQTAASPNRGYAMTFDTTVESSNVSFATSSAVRFTEAGVYNIQFSAQFANYDNQDHDVDIWFVLNGSRINWSNSRFSIIGTHGGINGHYIAAWNYMSTFNVNDELEIYWQTDDIQVQLEKIPASGDAPETPSIILTVEKI